MKASKSICSNNEVALKIQTSGLVIKEDKLFSVSDGELVAADILIVSVIAHLV